MKESIDPSIRIIRKTDECSYNTELPLVTVLSFSLSTDHWVTSWDDACD